jgi:hypothetical protein
MSDDSPQRRKEAGLFSRMLRGRRALPVVLEPDRDRDDAGWRPVGDAPLKQAVSARTSMDIEKREALSETLPRLPDPTVEIRQDGVGRRVVQARSRRTRG